jgi:hypothetical protein
VSEILDLGHDHTIQIAVWDPDLDLNPGLRHLAAQLPAKTSGIVTHRLPDGGECGDHGYIRDGRWVPA